MFRRGPNCRDNVRTSRVNHSLALRIDGKHVVENTLGALVGESARVPEGINGSEAGMQFCPVQSILCSQPHLGFIFDDPECLEGTASRKRLDHN